MTFAGLNHFGLTPCPPIEPPSTARHSQALHPAALKSAPASWRPR